MSVFLLARRRVRAGVGLVSMFALAALVTSGVAVADPIGSAPPGFTFQPPVDAAIADGWRPPSTPYGPGNRGWEYDTDPGEVVRAAGDGVVAFAGPVADSLHVTVAHRGGLRTTYSHLESIAVAAGSQVARGDRVGTAADRVHFGVRLEGAYVDPGVLFRPGALVVRARLVDASPR